MLDGIPDSRVRATVVMHALATSRSRATSEHARTIIDGLPGRQLRDEMLETLAALPPGEARPH